MKFKFNYKFQNTLFIIIILCLLFFIFTYLNWSLKINKVNKINKKIELFNDYYSSADTSQNLCYFDNVKNEIDQNYDLQDLKFNLYKCLDYINPDGCFPSNLVDQLKYIKDNMDHAYYDSSINPAFSCNCYKLMNIKYSGLDPEVKKLIDEIQSTRSSFFIHEENNNLDEISQNNLSKNPDDLDCYQKHNIINWCSNNEKLNDISNKNCPIFVSNYKEQCSDLVGTLKLVNDNYFTSFIQP
jgi:hypothetical protein